MTLELALIVALVLISYPFIELATFFIVIGAGRRALRFTSGFRVVCALGLVIEPACMLMIANESFQHPWPESAMLLAWGIAGASVLVSLWNPRRLRTSSLNFLAILVLAGISICYLSVTIDSSHDVLGVVPLASLVNVLLLARCVWRRGELNWSFIPQFLTTTRRKERNMNTQRFTAIAVIFAVASAGWAVLGNTIDYRTDQLERSLSKDVDAMWGPAGVVQRPPRIISGRDQASGARYDSPSRSDIDVTFEHHNRYKGLLWFSTYTVHFSGVYEVEQSDADATFRFELPEDIHSLEDLTFKVDDTVIKAAYSSASSISNTLEVPLGAGGEHVVEVAYTTRARDRWVYASQWHTAGKPAMMRNFTLTARTDFANIDYPKGSVSPTSPAEKSDGGAVAKWQYQSMRANQTMGVEMPARTNAGPIAARMSFFAPISLAFFFTVLFTVVVLKKLPLHPMHYLFISAGFFAFHILMAYLVDLISIHAAFWICAAVSTALVVSYMRLVAGVKFAVAYVGAAQLVYLVGFSYAFLWVGATGLTLTIGAIATLFVLMQATGKVDWHEVFRRSPEKVDPWVGVPPLPENAQKAGETQ